MFFSLRLGRRNRLICRSCRQFRRLCISGVGERRQPSPFRFQSPLRRLSVPVRSTDRLSKSFYRLRHASIAPVKHTPLDRFRSEFGAGAGHNRLESVASVR